MTSEFIHHSIKITGVVTSQTSGWLEFDEPNEDIGASFRSKQFEAYAEGTRLECSFRVGDSRRQLLYCKPIGHAPMPDSDFGSQDDEADRLAFPQRVDDYYVPDGIRSLLGTVCRIVEDGGHFNLLARGPSGYGKTALYEALGKHLGYRVVMVNCAVIMDTEQWFGYQEARGGETVFLPSEFSEAIIEGNAVVVLDEANRIEPWLSNSLFPLLDHRRQTVVHGVPIAAGKSIVFGHTVNEGVKFAGTHVMDAAYLNRIDAVIEVNQLPAQEEVAQLVSRCGIDKEKATKIVSTNRNIRSTIESQQIDVDASTRTSLKVGRLVSYGMSIQEAFEYVLVNASSIEERKAIIDIVRQDATTFVHPDHNLIRQMREILKRGNKIEAIKFYREKTGAGLKEAKEFVESL